MRVLYIASYISQYNINQVLIEHDRPVPWVEDDSLNLIYL